MQSVLSKGRAVLAPISRFLAERNVSPTLLTLLGVISALCAGFFYRGGGFILGAVFLAIGGLFDLLDGDVARMGGKVSKRGAYLDSTLDRLSEFIPLFGIMLYYIEREPISASLAVILIFGSLMVSYTRARAEGLGIKCKIGFADRSFRIIFLIIGSLFGERIFIIFLLFLAISVCITFIMRMAYCLRRL